jgi:hypothetical protein
MFRQPSDIRKMPLKPSLGKKTCQALESSADRTPDGNCDMHDLCETVASIVPFTSVGS